ncbi:hypothetical protein W02_07210 [Nitrospira sp. KM1]|nr:hypothetical protein W02_07210 [Nitrospira sp. KM1]
MSMVRAAFTVSVNAFDPVWLVGTVESWTVNVTFCVPLLVGVPLIVPVEALKLNPNGRPTGWNERGAAPPVAVSVVGV